MCGDPVTIAMMAMQVAQGVSAQNAAVEGAVAQNNLYLQNATNAREAALETNRGLNRRQDQEAQARAQKSLDLLLNTSKAKATAVTAAGESGVAGSSVNRLLDSYERTRSFEQGTINRNFDMVRDQLTSERAGLKYQFNQRRDSVSKGYAPSAFQAGLGIAANVGSTYLMGSRGGNKVFGKEAYQSGMTDLFGKGTYKLPFSR